MRTVLDECLKLDKTMYNSPSVDSSSDSVDIPFQYGKHINIKELSAKNKQMPTISYFKKIIVSNVL